MRRLRLPELSNYMRQETLFLSQKAGSLLDAPLTFPILSAYARYLVRDIFL